jgi:hypothetical protein
MAGALIKAELVLDLGALGGLAPELARAAARGAAEAIAMYSDPLVPVDSSHLRNSSRTYHTPNGANTEWSGRGGAHNPSKNDYDYAAIQYEANFNHKGQGTDHWAEKAQQQHAGAIQDAAQASADEVMRRAS